MPNIKSAIKRVKVNDKKNEQNRATKSRINTAVRKFKLAVDKKDLEEATKLYNEVSALVDSAASKNVIHKNTASRKKARLALMLKAAK